MVADGRLRSLRTSGAGGNAGGQGDAVAGGAQGSGIDPARAQAVYVGVFASFDAEISAVMGNYLLTPEQRGAMIACIRHRQRSAAENAMRWVMDSERAAAKERAVWRRPARRSRSGREQPERPCPDPATPHQIHSHG